MILPVEQFITPEEVRHLLGLFGSLGQREPIDSEPRQRLIGVRENLYRMWLET